MIPCGCPRPRHHVWYSCPSRFHQVQLWYRLHLLKLTAVLEASCRQLYDSVIQQPGLLSRLQGQALHPPCWCRQGRHFLALAQSLGPHIGYHAEHHFNTARDLQKQVGTLPQALACCTAAWLPSDVTRFYSTPWVSDMPGSQWMQLLRSCLGGGHQVADSGQQDTLWPPTPQVSSCHCSPAAPAGARDCRPECQTPAPQHGP